MQKRDMTAQKDYNEKVAKHEKERAGNRCPHCSADIPPMTKICPECGKAITGNESEGDKELLKLIDDLELSLKSLKICTTENYRSRLADVETLISKAKRLYSENKKVQGILFEIEDQKAKVVDEFSKLSEDSDIAKLIDKMNDALAEMEKQKNYGKSDNDYNEAKGEVEATLRKLETRFLHDATAQKAIKLAKEKLAQLDKEATSVYRMSTFKDTISWFLEHKWISGSIIVAIVVGIFFLKPSMEERIINNINSGNIVKANELYSVFATKADIKPRNNVGYQLVQAFLGKNDPKGAESVFERMEKNMFSDEYRNAKKTILDYYKKNNMFDEGEQFMFSVYGPIGETNGSHREYYELLEQYITFLCEKGEIAKAKNIAKIKSQKFQAIDERDCSEYAISISLAANDLCPYTSKIVLQKLNKIIATYE